MKPEWEHVQVHGRIDSYIIPSLFVRVEQPTAETYWLSDVLMCRWLTDHTEGPLV